MSVEVLRDARRSSRGLGSLDALDHDHGAENLGGMRSKLRFTSVTAFTVSVAGTGLTGVYTSYNLVKLGWNHDKAIFVELSDARTALVLIHTLDSISGIGTSC